MIQCQPEAYKDFASSQGPDSRAVFLFHRSKSITRLQSFYTIAPPNLLHSTLPTTTTTTTFNLSLNLQTIQSNNMPSDTKDNKTVAYDAASISTSSIMSDKEKAQAQAAKKPSLVKRAVQAIKNIEPPEPRIPEGRRETLPAWSR